MLNKEKTDTAKLFYFGLFIAVNGLSCLFIPFILDYAHNVINGILIPSRLLWDEANQVRTDRAGWYTAQVTLVMTQFAGLLWLLYCFNRL